MTDDQPLMRYLTHDKFLCLLNPQTAFDAWSFLDRPPNGTLLFKSPTPREYGSLWMPLPKKFDDKDEGMFPALNADDGSFCDLAARHLGLSPDEAAERKHRFISLNPPAIRDGIRARTQLCGVSCWYQDSTESQRMWDEYVRTGQGVVITTTLKRFGEALGFTSPQYNQSARPMFATINYVDRDSFFLAHDGFYHLLSIKGDGFKHEREVRLIARSPDLVQATANHAGPSLRDIATLVASAGTGFSLLIDLKRLISGIRLYPAADASYLGTIQNEIKTKGMSPSIVKPSDLSGH